MRYITTLSALAAAVAAAKDKRTFAVLSFMGDGPVTEGRVDPIVNPGAPAGHVHTFQGASGISMTSTGEDLKKSSCSTAAIEGDMSAYWAPSLYFHDRANNNFEKVPLFYMKVYYFFDPTDDDIKAFPTGLQILAGNASAKNPPATARQVLLHGQKPDNKPNDPDLPIQPVGWVCPRTDENKEKGPRLYAANSDGVSGGMGVNNSGGESGEGVGFPDANCDGYASPLRADIHFPSCYDPSKGLKDFKNNMAYPTLVNGKHNCPKGWIHTPHMFYELYWNALEFKDRWTPGKGDQPFCLSNGDCKGYSLHADFLAAWDEPLLQHIIDTCDKGNEGMVKCDGVKWKHVEGVPDPKCKADNPFPEKIDGVMSNLPGNNPWYGFSGAGGAGSGNADAAPSPKATDKTAPEPSAKTSDKPAPEPSAKGIAQQPGVGGAKAVVPAPSSFTTIVTFTTVAATATSKAAEYGAPAPSSTQEAAKADTSPVPKKSIKPAAAEISGWKYAGCYKDTRDRVIQGVKFPSLPAKTNEDCVAYCQKHSEKYTVAGTENSGQCFCGKEVAGSEKLDDKECDKPCTDKESSFCGGEWAITVYSSDGSIKP